MHTLNERQRDALDRGLARWYRGRLIPIMRGAEGEGDDDAAKAAAAKAVADKAAADAEAAKDKTFTQTDVDRIVQERLARVKNTAPDDYEDLKTKAAEFDKLQDAQKTELEKANERAAKAERDAAAATETAKTTLVTASIMAAAAGKLADPSDAVALIDRAKLEFDAAGAPTNVAALIEELLKSKPHLAAGAGAGGDPDLGARRGAVDGQISRAALKDMTPEQITKALSEGKLNDTLAGKK